MNKIKTYLIHFLGGVTEEENKESNANSNAIGRLQKLYDLKSFVDSMNGTPADEWCKRMYQRIIESINYYEHHDNNHPATTA